MDEFVSKKKKKVNENMKRDQKKGKVHLAVSSEEFHLLFLHPRVTHLFLQHMKRFFS